EAGGPEELVAGDEARAAVSKPGREGVALEPRGDERQRGVERERPVQRRSERGDESADPRDVGDDQDGEDLSEGMAVGRARPEEREGERQREESEDLEKHPPLDQSGHRGGLYVDRKFNSTRAMSVSLRELRTNSATSRLEVVRATGTQTRTTQASARQSSS